MNSPFQRDKVCILAREDTNSALMLAREISDPWYRTQALSWVLRFAKEDHLNIAKEVSVSASSGKDSYQRSASRTWEVAALAQSGFNEEAKIALSEALKEALLTTPNSSRAEALILLMQAAYQINDQVVTQVAELIRKNCRAEDHWRCKRALTDLEGFLSGKRIPRMFFWESNSIEEPAWYKDLIMDTNSQQGASHNERKHSS